MIMIKKDLKYIYGNIQKDKKIKDIMDMMA